MHVLDRAAWASLTASHAGLAQGQGLARRYRPEIGPLAGLIEPSPEAAAALVDLIPPGGEVALLEPAPPAPPPRVEETRRAACVQMTLGAHAQQTTPAQLVALGPADYPEMLALAQLTRPGPFEAETPRLGRFLGVREEGRLIAMAGERMAPPGFIEVSAVCTHPDFRGRGLGAGLLTAVAARILAEGLTPFLHAYVDNAVAIALYRKLGFQVRAEVLHAVWRRR